MVAKFVARQLGEPSGAVGGWILAPLWNKRNAALNDFAFERLALQTHDRVLEVGFGGGYLLGKIAASVTHGDTTGVDHSETMVAVCERRYQSLVRAGKLELRCSPAESLPFSNGTFSKACTVNSLFYWRDAPRGLQEIHRVIEAGGKLVVCLTSKSSIEYKGFARHGLRMYEDDELLWIMEGAGFEIAEVRQASDRHRMFVCVVGVK